MLAGVPVSDAATAELATMVGAQAPTLADRLDQALADGVSLLALTIDERAIILAALEDPPEGLGEVRAVLLNELSRDDGQGSIRNDRGHAPRCPSAREAWPG